jgi:transcriptional regulator with XRE-family HTH domain
VREVFCRGYGIGATVKEMGALNDRVMTRLREFARQRGFQTALALRLKRTQSAITPYVKGEYSLGLDELEAIADVSGVPIAELVAPPDATIKQLNADEAELVRLLRLWPVSVTRALLAFVRPFGNEPAVERQKRNLDEYWRHFDAKERDWLLSLAVLLRERTLGPDLREGIVDRLTREANAGPGLPKVGRQDELPPKRRRNS